jgi:hypothetical protein
VRIFHDRLKHDKYTDRKHRWVKFVKAVKFQLYIHEERVPQLLPKTIEVSIFSHKELFTKLLNQVGSKTIADLSPSDKKDLANIGLSDDMIRVAGDTAIIGAAFLPSDKYEHTETIRYNAHRRDEKLKFGDPYIPKSVLGDHYPERLLFLVRWMD